MESKNNKETINLLDLLSESDSELSDLVLATPKKRKIKRRQRPRGRGKNSSSCICNRTKTRLISLWIAAVLITIWLISLSWLAAVLYAEIGRMDVSIRSAIADSEALPGAVQKFHSASQKLEKNQTILFGQLAGVKEQIADFSIQLSGVQAGLHQVQELLKRAPELTNVPKNLDDIKTSVATFGSKIQDLQATVDTLKGTDTKIQEIQTSLLKNITDIQNTLANLSNITQRPEISANETRVKTEELSQSVSQLRTDLIKINETLTRNLTWVQNDQHQDHTLLVSLQDRIENASTKVMSLEGECAKASEQSTIVASVKKLNDDLAEIQAMDVNFKHKIALLEQNYNEIKNSTDVILEKLASAKTRESNSVNEQSQATINSTQTTISQSAH